MRTESASVPLSIRIEYEWSCGSQGRQKDSILLPSWELLFPNQLARLSSVRPALLALVIMVGVMAVVSPISAVPMIGWGSGIV